MKSTRATVLKLIRALLVTTLMSCWGAAMADSKPAVNPEPQRLTLVGASIGQAWKFPQVGTRLALPGYQFDYVGVYDFDKSALIAGVLGSGVKPDLVLIKECSSYFPGDQSRQQQLVVSWVEQLRSAGIQPVLVTTAPPGEPTDYIERAKNIVKRLIGRPTVLDGVGTFNDWLKQYGQQQNLPVFDLEAVLRRSSTDRWMNPEYDSGDRVHLNTQAYAALDRAFASFLASLPMRRSK